MKTWEDAARAAAAELCRFVIRAWVARGNDALLAVKAILPLIKEGEYTPRQAFRHIAENGIIGYLSRLEFYADDAFEEDLEDTIDLVVKTIIAKQHDYGHENIRAFGREGLTVRLSDKTARVANLTSRFNDDPESVALNESLDDSWLDIAGYGLIGMMWEDGTFMLPLAADTSVVIDDDVPEYAVRFCIEHTNFIGERCGLLVEQAVGSPKVYVGGVHEGMASFGGHSEPHGTYLTLEEVRELMEVLRDVADEMSAVRSRAA